VYIVGYMFITANLMGGLGNQLFQIFATFAHSMKINYNVIFTYSGVLTTGKARVTYWNNFLDKLWGHTTLNLENEMTNRDVEAFPVYREHGFPYEKLPLFTNSHIKLYGYFQSYKYFEQPEIYNKICDIIDLRGKQNSVKMEYHKYFPENKRIISMHFRLGDYKNIQQFHPLMPVEYYDAAISSMPTGQEYRINYFCEKEDNAAVSETIDFLSKKYPQYEFVKIDDDIEDWKQMLLMSCCHDNIIANSSFSWWGAYFNSNPDKCVYYPEVWFGPANSADVSDLFPRTWWKISLTRTGVKN